MNEGPFCKDCVFYYRLWQGDYCTKRQRSGLITGTPDVRTWDICQNDRE